MKSQVTLNQPIGREQSLNARRNYIFFREAEISLTLTAVHHHHRYSRDGVMPVARHPIIVQS